MGRWSQIDERKSSQQMDGHLAGKMTHLNLHSVHKSSYEILATNNSHRKERITQKINLRERLIVVNSDKKGNKIMNNNLYQRDDLDCNEF